MGQWENCVLQKIYFHEWAVNLCFHNLSLIFSKLFLSLKSGLGTLSSWRTEWGQLSQSELIVEVSWPIRGRVVAPSVALAVLGLNFKCAGGLSHILGSDTALAWAGLTQSHSSSRSNENVSPLYKWVISRGWLATTAEKLRKRLTFIFTSY